MSTRTKKLQSLFALIQDESRHYAHLMDLLNKQRVLILERETNTLLDLNEQMIIGYDKLKKISQQRIELMLQLGVTANTIGMQALISELPLSYQKPAKQLWRYVEKQLHSCKQQNDHNANILHYQQQLLNQILQEDESFLYYESR